MCLFAKKINPHGKNALGRGVVGKSLCVDLTRFGEGHGGRG